MNKIGSTLSDNNVETRPCFCGQGTVTKIILDIPREIPGQPNQPQTVEYECSSCGITKLVDCKTDKCTGKIWPTSKGNLHCNVCEKTYPVKSPTKVEFW